MGVRKGSRAGASSSSAAARAGGGAFTSFAAATAAALDGAAPPPPAAAWDASALALLRAAAKKDPTTRAKALTELRAALAVLPARDEREDGVGREFLVAWGERFPGIAVDVDVAVRVGGFGVMGEVVVVFGRDSQRVLRSVLPSWAAGLGDSAAVVAAAARDALAAAFPGDEVRRKLAAACGGAVGEYCVAEVEAVRVSGDETQLRRALAAARWTVEVGGTLEHVADFLDGGAVLRAATGVKVAKKGAAPVAVPKEACDFVAACVVPQLPRGDGGGRAELAARMTEACVRAGEPAGWGLLLAVLNNGMFSVFGDWAGLRGALRVALAARALPAAALSSLLPMLCLLPGEGRGVESAATAELLLGCLRREILPGELGQGGGVDGGASVGMMQARGFRTMFARSALPAYLECVAYAAEAGAARWLAGDGKAREALQTWLVYEHIEPALAQFLTGMLLPPSPRRPIAGRRPDADRRRGNGKGDVEGEAAQLFAGALAVAVSLKGDIEMESLLHQVLRAVLPLRGPLAKPLGLRLGAVAHELSQKPSLVLVATSFVQRAVQETIGVDEVLESDLSLLVALSKADLEPASVLGAGISGGDEDTGVAAALTAEYATEYAVGAMEKLPSTVESMELVGSLLSWVAVASSDYGVTVIDAMSSSELLPETDRLGLFASVLSAHRARGHFMKGDTLDTIVVDSVARLKGSADFPNTLVPFVQSAVSTGCGGAALKQSSLAKVASILRQCLIGYRNVDGALDICKCTFIGRSPDGGALDDLAAVVVMFLSPMESRVASAVEVVLAYCSRVSSAGACDLLGRILKLLCSSLLTRPLELGERWSRVVDAIATSAEGTRLAHIGALRVCDDLMKGGNPADAAAVNLFLTSVLVSSSPQKVLPVDAGQFDSQAFVTEYERVAMIPLDVDANSSKVIETAKRDLRSRVSSRHGSSNAEAVASAPHVAACIVDRLLRCDDRDVGQTAPLLELLETCLDSDDASNDWATAGAVAAALGKDIVPAAADIVSVCSAVLLRQGLAAFRPLLDEAVLSVRRDKGEGSACSGLAVLAAALTPLRSDLSWRPPDLDPWPPWLSECLTSALSALRRNLEASARDTSGRALLGPGSLLVARAIGGGFSLSDDDWRYWSLAALDALREAQLTDSDSLDVTLVRDICSMALLASAMVSSCGSRDDGPSMAELVTHGGWSGIKFLNAALDDGLCPVSGLVSLMSAAVDGNALIRNGHSLPMEPEEVYALVPRLGHKNADVRVAVFACVAAVACDDLPRFLDLALASGETFADEESEEAAMRDLVPCAIREALRWPKEAEDGNSSYAELGFFMSWLLFLQLVKGVDELRRVANGGAADSGGTESESGGSSAGACGGKAAAEDRSFRRVSLGFLRADSGVFAEFFTRCLGVVIDGNAAEKTAAAGASSSITEDLTHWLRHLGGNPEEYGDGLDWQVGRCAGAAFAHALQLLPALSRQHVADAVDHGLAGRVEDYVRRRVSPLLVAEEVRKVREWGDSGGDGSRAGGDGDGELSTRGSTAGREVWAAYTVSEVRLEISLRLPEAYPLAAVEIEDAAGNGERIGRGLWRRTLLQMNALLRGKDGSLAEAVALWRRSLDLRLGGLEDCPVCYSVLHLSNSTLPSVRCGTCTSVYHGACLYKWFTKSSTRSCPMCRSTIG